MTEVPPPTAGPGGGSGDAPDDRDLVRASLRGDPRAFEEIVRRYQRGLYNLAWRMVRDRETGLWEYHEGYSDHYPIRLKLRPTAK